jgi:hypothetical protein
VEKKESKGGPTTLYGVGMHAAIATGDLQKMKTLSKQAEEHLAKYGDVKTALKALNEEIARLESLEKKKKE